MDKKQKVKVEFKKNVLAIRDSINKLFKVAKTDKLEAGKFTVTKEDVIKSFTDPKYKSIFDKDAKLKNLLNKTAKKVYNVISQNADNPEANQITAGEAILNILKDFFMSIVKIFSIEGIKRLGIAFLVYFVFYSIFKLISSVSFLTTLSFSLFSSSSTPLNFGFIGAVFIVTPILQEVARLIASDYKAGIYFSAFLSLSLFFISPLLLFAAGSRQSGWSVLTSFIALFFMNMLNALRNKVTRERENRKTSDIVWNIIFNVLISGAFTVGNDIAGVAIAVAATLINAIKLIYDYKRKKVTQNKRVKKLLIKKMKKEFKRLRMKGLI